MTFNSRLAKLAEKLAEETFPLKMYIDESLPKLAHSSFTRGALHPTIEAAIREDERRIWWEQLKKAFPEDAEKYEVMVQQCNQNLQRLLSEGGEKEE